MFALVTEPFDPAEAYRVFASSMRGAGAIVSFVGQVRDLASDAEVESLVLQAYSPLTEKDAERAIQKAVDRWALHGATATHRIGAMEPGAVIVFVAAASAHRRAAFEAADFLMDYFKMDAFFWKKEVTSVGAAWIEPRAEDHQDKRRWG